MKRWWRKHYCLFCRKHVIFPFLHFVLHFVVHILDAIQEETRKQNHE